ncbi:MAG: MBL fold metallo-hydrolase [archaeon]|jgi:L-ascorbate metabolism protein UlaG (beta-lactamase superfamily)
MKITKFAQSCVMIETNNTKILVDPGVLSGEDELVNMKEPDFVFVTHKHSDHFNEEIYNKIKKETTKIYSTNEVQNNFTNTKFEILKEKDIIDLGEIKVEVVKAVHGYLPLLTKNNAEINENVGYIIEIKGKKLYFTSDSISFKNDYKCNIVFVPVCNHGLVMGPYDAALFSKETGAEIVIPIHYDNPKYPGNLEKVKDEFNKQELNYKILEKGQIFEI